MSQKFLSNIELNAGLVDANDAAGTSGQVLSSTGTGVEWIDQAAITGAESNKTYYEVKNSSGATILKGKGVMAVGTDGNSGHILIDEMVADGTVEPRYFMGVLEDSLDNGEIGTVIAFGELDQFNTTGQNGETWTNGQILWCDPDSAGDFTTTQPNAPSVKIPAAFILKASTQGKIQIRVQANEGLHELHDTHITTQSDGEILVWDNTNEYWFNDGTLTVDYTNGRVGIGTASPAVPLHVDGFARLNGGLQLNTTNAQIYQIQNSSLRFGTNNTERLIIDSAGKVGINEANPDTRLHIVENGGSAQLTLERTGSGAGKAVLAGAAEGLIVYDELYGQKMYVGTAGTYNGRVGIGTTSPSERLVVDHNTNSDASIRINNANTGASSHVSLILTGQGNNFYLRNWGDGTSKPNTTEFISTAGGSQFIFSTNNAEAMRITSAGNVGIGTTSPLNKLHVLTNNAVSGLTSQTQRGINVSDSNGARLTLEHTNAASGQKNFVLRSESGVFSVAALNDSGSAWINDNILNVKYNGNVGIGTTSPQEELEVKSAQFTTIAVNTDRNTANENIGSFAFYGRNNATTPENLCYSRIMSSMTDVTDGSENSDIFFQQINNGTVIETFRVSSAGTVDITGDLDVNGNLDAVNGTFSGNLTLGNNQQLKFKNSANNAIGVMTFNTSNELVIFNGNSTAGDIIFKDGGPTGTTNLIIDGLTGNVGIGTTDPNHKVDIYSEENVPLRIHRPNNANLDSSGAWGIGFSTRGDSNTSTTDTRAGIFSYYNGNLFLATGTSSIVSDPDAYARLTVTNAGKIGIGTSSPNSTLHVDGDMSIQGAWFWYSGYTSTTGSGVANGTTIEWRDGITALNTAYMYTVRLTTSGTGTNSGSTYIVNYNPDTTTWEVRAVSLSGTNSNHPLLAMDGNTMVAYTNHTTSYPIRWSVESVICSDNDGTFHNMGADFMWQRNADDLRYDDGKVGIGMDAVEKFEVAGNIKANTANGGGFFINGNSGIVRQGSEMEIHTNGASRLRISDTGVTTFNNDVTVDGTLDAVGGTFTGNININSTYPRINLNDTDSEDDWAIINANGTLEFYNVDDDVRALQINSDNNSVFNGSLTTYGSLTVNGGSSNGIVNVNGLGDSFVEKDNGNHLYFANNAQDKNIYLRVNDGGTYTNAIQIIGSTANVGIGTASPSEKLEVNGNITNSGDSNGIYWTGGTTNSQNRIVIGEQDLYGVGFRWDSGQRLQFDGFWNTSVKGSSNRDLGSVDVGNRWWTFENRVGIGTTLPYGKLELKGSGNSWSTAPAIRMWDDLNSKGWLVGNVNNMTAGDFYIRTLPSISGNPSTGQQEFTIKHSTGNVGIGTTSPTAKLDVSGSIRAGGKTTYTKTYSSLSTTGSAVAGLTNGSNGSSACFIFTCFGGGGYQRVIYSCANVNGVWNTSKDIDEGVNIFDVSVTTGTAPTFTFKARASSQSYSPTVTVEHHGSNLNTTYL